MVKGKVVASQDFIYPVKFAPIPEDEADQSYYSFRKGDVLPDDVAERLGRLGTNLIVRNVDDTKILSMKKQAWEERGKDEKEATRIAKQEMGEDVKTQTKAEREALDEPTIISDEEKDEPINPEDSKDPGVDDETPVDNSVPENITRESLEATYGKEKVDEVYDLRKAEQVDRLQELGVSEEDIATFTREVNRAAKILELSN